MINFIQQHIVPIAVITSVALVIGSLAAATIQEQRRARVPAGLDPEIRRGIGEKIQPAPGDRRWSRHFGSYVEMVHYRSDTDYHFKVLSGLHAGRTYKNQSPWSRLERWNPDPVYTPRSRKTI